MSWPCPKGTVADAMSTEPLWIGPDDTLDRAEVVMALAESRHVPVVLDGKLEGILSVRDMLAGARLSRAPNTPRADYLHEVTVRQVMTAHPVVVCPGDDLVHAAQLLRKHSISSLPVVSEGELVGILTSSDLVEEAVRLLIEEERELGSAPLVSRIMKRRPTSTIDANGSVDLAAMLMKVGHFRHLPVMMGDLLVGMISDRDILAALGISPGERLQIARPAGSGPTAKEIMSARVRTTSPEAHAKDAGRALLDWQIGALPVMERGKLMGIVTEADFLGYLITCSPSEIDRESAFHRGHSRP